MAAALNIHEHNDHSAGTRLFLNLLTLTALGLLLYFAAGYSAIYFGWTTPPTRTYGITALSSMEIGIYMSLAILSACRAIMALGGTNNAKIAIYFALLIVFFGLCYWLLFTAERM